MRWEKTASLWTSELLGCLLLLYPLGTLRFAGRLVALGVRLLWLPDFQSGFQIF